MVNNYLFIIPIVVAIIAVAFGIAYQTGALNPIFEKIGVYYFKAEAKAEEKKMEAQGLKDGEDFLKGKFLLLH
jgi:transposase